MNLLYIIFNMYHNEQNSPTVLLYLAKSQCYKWKWNSLRYKHCDTHNSTALLRRMSTKTRWLIPFHPHCVSQSTFSVRLLLVSLDLVEDWLICSTRLTRPCGNPYHRRWLYMWLNRLKILNLYLRHYHHIYVSNLCVITLSCVCVWDREWEGERVCVCARVCMRACACDRGSVCETERAREGECACVWEREREREIWKPLPTQYLLSIWLLLIWYRTSTVGTMLLWSNKL